MKVVSWTDWDSEHPDNPLSISGGWVDGEGFEAYLEGLHEAARPYACGLRDAILQEGRRIAGDEHQNVEGNVPVFEDGTATRMSYRAWGDLMAAIYNTHENTSKYTYMSFYMYVTREWYREP